MGLDLTTYAMIVEELSRGWISISGVVNTHFIGSYLLMKFGSDEQKEYFLPKMATGEIRAAFSLSEPGPRLRRAGDLHARQEGRRRLGDQRHQDVGHERPALGRRVPARQVGSRGRPAAPRHDLLRLREGAGRRDANSGDFAGLSVPPQIKKMGYKGVESTELVFEDYRCPSSRVLGGEEAGLNKGFSQMMDALEVGRVNVAARGVGIAQRALELALRYSQERQHVRQADRGAPGDPVQARRHGHQGRGRSTAHDQGGPDEGRRRALRPRGRHGQAVRLRDRQGGRGGVVPDPRRLRLLEGVRDRAPLPRRAAAR